MDRDFVTHKRILIWRSNSHPSTFHSMSCKALEADGCTPEMSTLTKDT